MSTNISSINIQPLKGNSEHHNFDTHRGNLGYVFHERTELNEHWELNPGVKLSEYHANIEKLYKEKTGQKMQRKATPIREGVVNMSEETTMEDLLELSNNLHKEFGIKPLQIHIHEDEGYINKVTGDLTPNRHAHIIFEWMDKEKGTSIKLKQMDMRKMQDITSTTLKMNRGKKIVYEKDKLPNGKLKAVPNTRHHLTPEQYKNMKDKLSLDLTIDKFVVHKKGKFLNNKKIDIDKTMENISELLKAFEGVQSVIDRQDSFIKDNEAEAIKNMSLIDSYDDRLKAESKKLKDTLKELKLANKQITNIHKVLSPEEFKTVNTRIAKLGKRNTGNDIERSS